MIGVIGLSFLVGGVKNMPGEVKLLQEPSDERR